MLIQNMSPILRRLLEDQWIDYSRSIISVTTLSLVENPFLTIHTECPGYVCWTLLENYRVKMVESRHRLRLSASLEQFYDSAAKWVKAWIWVSHIYRNNDLLLFSTEIITISRHSYYLTAVFQDNWKFLYMVHFVLSYSNRFELEYGVSFLKSQTRGHCTGESCISFHPGSKPHYLPLPYPYPKFPSQEC